MDNRTQQIISRIVRLAAEGVEVDELKAEIHYLLSINTLSIGSVYQPGVSLYRATKHHRSVPTHIQEIWHPPPERTSWNRANRPQQPMFYCTSDPNCAFQEIGINLGDFVVLANWITTVPMLLHDLGFTTQVLTRTGSRRLLPERHETFYTEKLNQEARTVRDFIALAFTESNPSDYRLTVALAEIHLQADEFAGILYPSVMKNANTDNLALHPAFAETGLRLAAAKAVRVDEVSYEGSIGGQIVCELGNVSADGDLTWLYPESGIPLPPKGSRAVRPGDIIKVQTPGDVEIDGRRYHLEAGYSIQMMQDAVVVRDAQGNIIAPL